MSPSVFQPPREALLAEGASARVYVSRDASGVAVALKLSRGAEWDGALRAEIGVADRVRHPSLLAVLGHGETSEGRAWLLLPLLSGKTLADWHPPIHELLEAIAGVGDALDLLHHAGLGHSDLKPANLLLDEGGGRPRLVLGDLGLVSPLGEPAPGGTPAYLSPSRLDGQPLKWTDDLHAFAVLLAEAVCGELPWAAKDGADLLKAIRTGSIESISARCPSISAEFESHLAGTMRGLDQSRGMMGWLDRLYASIGLPPAPRCLFLRPAADDEVEVAIGTRARLASWLEAHLYSVTSDGVKAGHEELRTLEALGGGSQRRLRRVLELLLHAQDLREQSGLAAFSREPAQIRAELDGTLLGGFEPEAAAQSAIIRVLSALPLPIAREELEDWLLGAVPSVQETVEQGFADGVLTLFADGRMTGTGALLEGVVPAGVPALPGALFKELWNRGEGNFAARLRLVRLAASMGSAKLIDDLPQISLLETVERAPGEDCDGLLKLLRDSGAGLQAPALAGMLAVVRAVRTDRIDYAVGRYWEIEDSLDLDVSAALNRTLFYQLSESGRLRDANGFLRTWLDRRGEECAGTMVEIQMAAREVSVLAAYGAFEEARSRVETYERRFAGREGRWVLHMAQANLEEALGNRRQRILQSEMALSGLIAEGGPARMQLDLQLSIAGAIILCSDAEQWARVPELLDRSKQLASEEEILGLQQKTEVLHAHLALFRGDFAVARKHFLQAKRDAERSGELSRAQFIEGGLAIVHKETGMSYAALQALEDFGKKYGGAEGLRNTLTSQDELADVCILVGDLERAAAIIEAGLPAAEETGRGFSIGIFRGLRGRLRHLLGDPAAAAPDLRAAVEQLQAAHALRDRNQYLLELIDADSMEDRDGARVAAIIEHEEAVSERRLLPKAWLLESRRLRRAGAVRDAALALQQAFEVAATLENPEHRWPLHLEAAELALEAGAVEAAREDLERALDILRDLSLQYPAGPLRERFLARPDRRLVLVRLRALDV